MKYITCVEEILFLLRSCVIVIFIPSTSLLSRATRAHIRERVVRNISFQRGEKCVWQWKNTRGMFSQSTIRLKFCTGEEHPFLQHGSIYCWWQCKFHTHAVILVLRCLHASSWNLVQSADIRLKITKARNIVY